MPSAKPKGSDRISRRGRPPRPKVEKKAPAKAAPLTVQNRLFISRYMVHRNATRAYREAYPEATLATADTEGPRLSNDPRVSSEIAKRIKALEKVYARDAKKTLDEIAMIAFANPVDLFDEDGELIPVKNLPRHVAVTLKKFERTEIHAIDPVSGERRVVGHNTKFEGYSKLEALKLLATNEGSLVQKVEVGGVGDFDERLRAARERTEKAIRDRVAGPRTKPP